MFDLAEKLYNFCNSVLLIPFEAGKAILFLCKHYACNEGAFDILKLNNTLQKSLYYVTEYTTFSVAV